MKIRNICGKCGILHSEITNNIPIPGNAGIFHSPHYGGGKCVRCGGTVRQVTDGQRLPGDFMLRKSGIFKSILAVTFGWGVCSCAACWALICVGSNWESNTWNAAQVAIIFNSWILQNMVWMIIFGHVLLLFHILLAKMQPDFLLNEACEIRCIPIGQIICTIQALVLSCIVSIACLIWLIPRGLPSDIRIPSVLVRMVVGILLGGMAAPFGSMSLFKFCRAHLPESLWEGNDLRRFFQ